MANQLILLATFVVMIILGASGHYLTATMDDPNTIRCLVNGKEELCSLEKAEKDLNHVASCMAIANAEKEIKKQGCWSSPMGKLNDCEHHLHCKPRQDQLEESGLGFCCCRTPLCNQEVILP